jgi:uncharacterized membrane protein YhaH (DUF805 family)
MNYYIEVLRRWNDFSGRSRRAEFWYFVLFNLIIPVILYFLIFYTNTSYEIIRIIFWIYAVYCLVLIIPNLALLTRRMHDIGKSGWMIFINLIPIFGAIWFLLLLVRESDSGDNKYGKDRKSSW